MSTSPSSRTGTVNSDAERETDGPARDLAARLDELIFTALPPPHDATGERQRVRLHVPTPGGESRGTTMLLGQRFEGASYTGFAVQTYGHVLMHARGGALASAMHLQANGEVVVQSDAADLYSLAAGDAIHGARGGVYLAGGHGVSLVAGRGPEPEARAAEDEVPPSSHDGGGVATGLRDAWDFWSSARGAMVSALEAPGGEQGPLARHRDEQRALTAGAARPGYGKVARSPTVPGGLSLFGHGGVSVGTPGAASVHAGRSLALGAAETSVYGGALELLAGESLRVSSAGDTRVCAGERCDVSASGSLTLRSRDGAVSIEAPRVELGGHALVAEGGVATHEVSIEALDAVRVHTRGAGSANGIQLTAADGGLFAHGDERVEVVSRRAVDLRVGRFVIEIREDSLKIGMSESAGDAPSKPLVELKDNKLVLSVEACGSVSSDSEVGVGELSNGKLQKGIKYRKSDQSIRITGKRVNIL